LRIFTSNKNSSYRKIAPTVQGFVNVWTHGCMQCAWRSVHERFNANTNTRKWQPWTHENPHEVAECNFLYRFLFNVWCGTVDNNLTGPHVIEGCKQLRITRIFRKWITSAFRCNNLIGPHVIEGCK
jgi:hypothetical protein